MAAAAPASRSPKERGPVGDLSADSAAALRLAEGIKEEMMIVMLDVLQVAAHACARVCIQRLTEQRRVIVHCVEGAEALKEGPGDLKKTISPKDDFARPISPAAEVVKRKTSFYDLFEEEEPHAQGKGEPDRMVRMTSGDSEPVKPEDDNLEEMYDDLDNSVAKLRAALADRRKQMQDAGVYESDDEDVFDLHALLEGADTTGGPMVGLASAAGLLPPSLRNTDVPHRGLQLPDSRLHSRRMSTSSSCASNPLELAQPEAGCTDQPCVRQRLDSDSSADAADSADEAEEAEPPLADEAGRADQLCVRQRLDSDASAGSAGSARRAAEAEEAEPPLADEAEPVIDGPAIEEEDNDASADAADSVVFARRADEAEEAQPPLADEAEPVSDGAAIEEEDGSGGGGCPRRA